MKSNRFFKIKRFFKFAASELDYTFHGLDCDQCDGKSTGYILDDGSFISSKNEKGEIADLDVMYIDSNLLQAQNNLIKIYNSMEISSKSELNSAQQESFFQIIMDCTRNCFDPNEDSEIIHYMGASKSMTPIKEFLTEEQLEMFMGVHLSPETFSGDDDAASPGRNNREFNSIENFEGRELDASSIFPKNI